MDACLVARKGESPNQCTRHETHLSSCCHGSSWRTCRSWRSISEEAGCMHLQAGSNMGILAFPWWRQQRRVSEVQLCLCHHLLLCTAHLSWCSSNRHQNWKLQPLLLPPTEWFSKVPYFWWCAPVHKPQQVLLLLLLAHGSNICLTMAAKKHG